LVNAVWRRNGPFQFRVAGTSGEQYVLEASTDFNTWIAVQTNTATLYDFIDNNASNLSFRGYRARLLP
jgi:hypothetical protein